MAEFMPHFAPVVALFFLGTVLLLGASFLVLFYGAVRRSSFFTKLGAGAAFTIVAGYLILLTGVSFASSEEVLPPGGWKYFCEIDCHIAHSLAGAQTAAALGPEMQQVAAHGKFVIVRVKTWFDERTISAHRGNGPLTPNRRRVLLVDDTGRSFVSLTGRSSCVCPNQRAIHAALAALASGRVVHNGLCFRRAQGSPGTAAPDH